MEKMLKYPVSENEIINLFTDAFYESGLKYNCKDLFNAGVENLSELATAIFKSMQSIKQAGLKPKRHFKHYFVTDVETGSIYNDWHMSKTGFLLVVMHVSGNSPLLNKIKIELARLAD